MMNIGFVGTGQMAQALGGGIAASHRSVSFVVSDPAPQAIETFRQRVDGNELQVVPSNAHVFRLADVVFLAVKPQYFSAAINREEIAQALLQRDVPPLTVSIIAGIGIEAIQSQTGIDSVIRVMPNTPCLVGAGACGMASASTVTDSQIELIETFLTATGMVISVDESLLDAVTGLSGSGPAYIFELIDSLAIGGVRCGLTRPVAQKLAIQTIFGAAKLAMESEDHPSVLRDRVASPAGTTIAGIKALVDHGFQRSVIAAVEAATDRSRELGQS